MADQNSMYLIDEYISVAPGEPYRLFPFGKIYKDGKVREVTPELAAKFKLPHFKPPIKRGSHAESAPAGGHIKALEVRADGLWAIPEYNENGMSDVQSGAYRYHSPEVIWSDGDVFEDPQTGEFIQGPLIVGDALLHMPHLGEAAALYSVEPNTEGNENMSDQLETVAVPKSFWDSFVAFFKPEPKPETEPVQAEEFDADQFAAVARERDEYKAEIDRMKSEAERAARVESFAAELKETKVNGEFAEILAGMDGEVAARFVQEFKALSAQINESALLDERGTEGDGQEVTLDAAIKAKMADKKVDYATAFNLVRAESPELVQNYGG